MKQLKYNLYRLLCNVAIGKTKQKFFDKKIKYKNWILNDFPKNPNFKKLKEGKFKEGVEALKLNRLPVCLAPHNSMLFDPAGRISACCANKYFHNYGRYPEKSLRELWFNNENRKKLRNALNKYDFSLGCGNCKNRIEIQDYGLILNGFNEPIEKFNNGYPSRMEFEFSNVCNYECIMCGGNWSSSIRKNREKLPPIISPYDDKFVEELTEFIPHLKHVNFMGGEPFLARLYYKIWDKFALLNKNLSIHVTSNCSIYNNRVQNVLDKLPNMRITVSCDSLEKKSYEIIRRNGKFENFYNNFMTFLSQGRIDMINCCALIQNIYEIPHIIDFCSEHNIGIYFIPVGTALGGLLKGIHENGSAEAVWYDNKEEKPDIELENKIPEFRLSTLPKDELIEIDKMIEQKQKTCAEHLVLACQNLRNQIKGYIEQK